jgi:hypothetical protein
VDKGGPSVAAEVASEGFGEDTAEVQREILSTRSLDPTVRQLVRFGIILVIACVLCALVGQLTSKDDLAAGSLAVEISTPAVVAVIIPLAVGWAFVLVAIVGTSRRVRLPTLGVLIFGVPGLLFWAALNTAYHGDRLARTGQAILVTAPLVASIGLLWLLNRGRHLQRPFSLATVARVTGALTVPFMAYGLVVVLVQRLGGYDASSPGPGALQLALNVLFVSVYILLPLYAVIGVYTSEVLVKGSAALVVGPRRGGPRAGTAIAVFVAFAAIVSEILWASVDVWINATRPSFSEVVSGTAGVIVFRYAAPAPMLQAVCWAAGTVLMLSLARWRGIDVEKDLQFKIAFIVLVGFWVARVFRELIPYGQVGGTGEDPSLPVFGVVGVVVLLLGLVALTARPVAAGHEGVLAGLAGLWLLFQALPPRVPPSVDSYDPVGPADPLVISGLVLLVVSLLSCRYERLGPLRTALAGWTLALVLIRGYFEILQKSEALPDIFGAAEAGLFLALLVLAVAPASVHRWRRVLAAIPLVLVLILAVFGLIGGGGSGGIIAQTIILATAALWEMSRSGGHVTNFDGRHWKRDSRVLAYLGCVLIGLAVAVFYASAESPVKQVGQLLEQQRATIAGVQASGLLIIGIPVAAIRVWADLQGHHSAP